MDVSRKIEKRAEVPEVRVVRPTTVCVTLFSGAWAEQLKTIIRKTPDLETCHF